MQWSNDRTRYGVIHVALHWLIALTVFGLFGLGFYMVDLTYYDDGYRSLPDLHRSIGLTRLAAMLLRLVWRLANPLPAALPTHKPYEIRLAHLVHGLLYLLIFTAIASGYLISTADGSSVDVFGLFEVPSLTGSFRDIEELAGTVHYWATWALVGFAGLHGAAALKHHFIDRDDTLRRMSGRAPRKNGL